MLIARGAQLPAFDFLQVGTPFPFPVRRARAFAAGKTDVLVFEELDHVIEDDLLMLAGRDKLSYRVHGKLDGSTLARGREFRRKTAPVASPASWASPTRCPKSPHPTPHSASGARPPARALCRLPPPRSLHAVG